MPGISKDKKEVEVGQSVYGLVTDKQGLPHIIIFDVVEILPDNTANLKGSIQKGDLVFAHAIKANLSGYYTDKQQLVAELYIKHKPICDQWSKIFGEFGLTAGQEEIEI